MTRVVRQPDLAVRPDRNADLVVEHRQIVNIFPAAFGKPLPTVAAIVGAEHKAVFANGPAGKLIGKINGNELWICAYVERQPCRSAVASQPDHPVRIADRT